jgi:tripartite-type tricarboxylate transporter receptor subunit TctC
MNGITTRALAVIMGISLLGAGLAQAQPRASLPGNYPNKAIRIIVGSSPGGGADNQARIVAPRLADRWKNPVVVVNQPSAMGGLLALESTAKAPPDGYTLMLAASSSVLNATMVTKSSLDVLRDYIPVAQLTAQPWILSVPASLPVNSVKELIAYAKGKPGELNYASAGNGSAAHLGMEMFNSLTGTKIAHIPYKGIGPGLLDMIAGRVHMLLATPSATTPHIRSGKVKALAVTSGKRSRLLPDVPTLVESGLTEFDVSSWFGIFAPTGTPQPIVNALNHEIVEILKLPEVQKHMLADGSEPAPVSSAEFRATMVRELERWHKVIKAINFKLDPE